jgi:hypothetical protein
MIFGLRLPDPAAIDLIEVRRLAYSCRNPDAPLGIGR